ncbi:hypothetical protein Dvina_32625 [Dactylosporangium vinaceum]|uniref:Uncharacterized protein n=1 Tax=Dactylosporangium vinaceum TaxID=53362 RepID=A0ABV5MAA1_9ACTN|nr:hypothetical protein [Dactylosporangium vinaceum]UAB93032.1 hypothetical protein Dvina_32625 [Dactylosporangium vinaceum]
MKFARRPHWDNGVKSLVAVLAAAAAGIVGSVLTALGDKVLGGGVPTPVVVLVGVGAAAVVFVGGLFTKPEQEPAPALSPDAAAAPDGGAVRAERVAVSSGGTGELRLFAVTRAGAVLERTYRQDHGWSDWADRSLPDGPAHDVAATRIGSVRIDLFAADRRGRIWYRQYDLDGWQPWQTVDGTAHLGRVVRLAVASAGPRHRELWVLGDGGQVGHRWKGDGEAWSQWYDRSVADTLDVAMTVRRGEQLEVTRLKFDGRVRQRGWVNQVWEQWYDLGRPPTSLAGVAVSALSGSREHQEVFVVDASGGISHRWRWHDDPWSDWYEMEAPGHLVDVAAGITSDGRYEVIVADAAGQLHQRSYGKQDRWSDWRAV